jgi:hypothetical protein
MQDDREQYRRLMDNLVAECTQGQGPITARGDARDAYVSGVHDRLRILHEAGIPAFDEAHEGTPFHDFIGRLQGGTWPSAKCSYLISAEAAGARWIATRYMLSGAWRRTASTKFGTWHRPRLLSRPARSVEGLRRSAACSLRT